MRTRHQQFPKDDVQLACHQEAPELGDKYLRPSGVCLPLVLCKIPHSLKLVLFSINSFTDSSLPGCGGKPVPNMVLSFVAEVYEFKNFYILYLSCE